MSEMIEREVPLLGPDGRLDASQLPASVEQRLAVLEAAVEQLTAQLAALALPE